MSPRIECHECGGTASDWPPCGCGPLTHSETGRAWCALCDGTGSHYERCDVTGLPVPCVCPQCGGTRYADAPARAPITHAEVADVECPF